MPVDAVLTKAEIGKAMRMLGKNLTEQEVLLRACVCIDVCLGRPGAPLRSSTTCSLSLTLTVPVSSPSRSRKNYKFTVALSVEHTLLYLADILSKPSERDVPGGSEVW